MYFFALYGPGEHVSGVNPGYDVNWGARSDERLGSADLARVRMGSSHVVLRDQELLQFYDGSDPLTLTGLVARGVVASEDCPHDEVDYDLSVLPAGEYTMVHRRSSAPDGFEPYYGDVTWMTWEGEDALVTTIIRQP